MNITSLRMGFEWDFFNHGDTEAFLDEIIR
jgi:hypothetical protein